MKWFRFYDEALDDPKCQRLTPALFKHWINLLCLANRSATRGILPTVADIAFGLRLSEAKVRAILSDLEAAGLIDRAGETFQMHGWDQRQRVSDNVADRVSKHRERNVPKPLQEQKRNGARNVTGNVTDPLPHARGTEAETDTESETETGGSPPAPPAAGAAPEADAKPKRQRRRAETAIPDDWSLTPERLEFALSEGLSEDIVRHEFRKFGNYAVATDRRQVDWDASWRTWVLKAVDEYRPRLRSLPSAPARASPASSREDAERRLREMRAQEGAT